MSENISRWVKYKHMGGPRYLGRREGGKYIHVYNPSKPWGVWSQILGVVARTEGRHDTVVMYDETGVTFGAFQWTFKSGRLQKLLEFFKTIPYFDFESNVETNLFNKHFTDISNRNRRQFFEDYGFYIFGGVFVPNSSLSHLDPRNRSQCKSIVDICMGRRQSEGNSRDIALGLCDLFARIGGEIDIQAAMVEYAKLEFKASLDVKRKPLRSIGGTIRCLLPDEFWGTPIPALFFNLNQNSPGGSFILFKRALKQAEKQGLVVLNSNGYCVRSSNKECLDAILYIIWKCLDKSGYADWGFKSKQYLASGGKNPPRIIGIKKAIEEFYGVSLPYYTRLK